MSGAAVVPGCVQRAHACRVQQLEETHADARQKVAAAEARAASAQESNVKLYEKARPWQLLMYI